MDLTYLTYLVIIAKKTIVKEVISYDVVRICPTSFGQEDKNCTMHTLCTGCICLTFLHCVFPNESSNHLPVKLHLTKLHWLHSLDFVAPRGCITNHTSLLCIFKCVLKFLPEKPNNNCILFAFSCCPKILNHHQCIY